MGVNSLPKTVTRQRRGCDLNPDPSAPESSTLTTRLPEPPTGLDKRTTNRPEAERVRGEGLVTWKFSLYSCVIHNNGEATCGKNGGSVK